MSNYFCNFAVEIENYQFKTSKWLSSMVQVFSPYQMQILDSISHVTSDKELFDIRNLIADYFSNKALDAMDELCTEGKLSTSTIQSWSKEHLRTAYNR